MSLLRVSGILPSMRLSWRVVLYTTVVATAANVVTLLTVAVSLSARSATEVEREIDYAREAVAVRLEHESAVLLATTIALASEPSVAEAVGRSRDAGMQVATDDLRRTVGVDLLLQLDARGDVLSASPATLRVESDLIPLLWDRGGIALLSDGNVYMAVTHPVDVGDHRLGYLLTGRLLGPAFVRETAELANAETLMLVTGQPTASSLHSVSAEALAAATAGGVGAVEADGVSFATIDVPLGDHARLVLARNLDEARDRYADLYAQLGAVAVSSFAAAVVLAIIGARAIARPIQEVTDAALRIADGDLSDDLERSLPEPPPPTRAASMDEAQKLAAVFRRMVHELRRSRHALEGYAESLEAQVREKAHALEQAKAADRAKSAFLANMSHELRTPLNAIIGYSEMLIEDAADRGDPGATEDLEKIRGAGTHLLSLINSVLDLSKIEAGRMELHLEEVDIVTLVREIAATVQPLAQKNGNQIVVSCPERLGAMHSDAIKVRQVLFNLLSNACKFTEQGGITIRAGEELQDGREMVVFEVQDDGIGMDAEQVERLFQEFTQADSSTTRRYGGTGLGLTISRRFCWMMGGDIQAVSALGVGSTFRVVLPRDVAKRPEQPATDAPTPAATGTDVVLVVDDDPHVRDILVRSLQRDGFDAVGAASGDECLRLVRELRPAAITLDVLMPGMDGWSVLTALKAAPETADIPVVMITIADQSDHGYALGAEEFLTKPVDRDRLRETIRRLASGGHVALVIEDDANIRDMLSRTLERDGWTVEQAENGRVGLEKLEQVRPNVILLDLMMPEVDGFELLARLPAVPNAHGVPVVVMTAMDLTSDQRALLSARVSLVLQKGDHTQQELMSEVKRRVRAHVQRRREPIAEEAPV